MKLFLENKNFCLLFSARLITNVGDSMYFIAAMWLVYQLSGSSFYSGLAGFLTMLPRALQFIIGPILDRYSIKRLLIATQAAQAFFLLIIPIAAWFNLLSVNLVLIIMPLVSFLNQFSFPAESALIPQIVEKQQLVQANGLMTFAYQGTETVFQAIGGLLVMILGAVSLYSADVMTFLIAILLFASLILPNHNVSQKNSSMQMQIHRYFSDLQEGFQIVVHSVIGKMMVASLVTNFALGALISSLPAYGATLGGSGMYGLLMGAMAIGSLIGALIAKRFENKPIGKMLIGGYFIGFCLWMAAVLSPNPLLTVVLFATSMIAPGCNNVLNFTLIQSIVPRTMLARAMSLVASMATCIMPLGSLVGGSLTSLFGPKIIFFVSSFGFLFYSLYVLTMPILRHLPSAGNADPENYGFPGEVNPIQEQV
ncbi:MFS transporter [Sporolactobacillus kofuensis]|uniref:MFS transporter n=1 Tax=Sporolactobacillus kofuensis TaxID=269672 RepID=A0ABW1WEC4_9BACL|nr:MFS transporter [Sporolactobacillus kofuensis]MCO7174758.1 MFS transporter [Sporolactobacillus kofuensis]